MNCVQDIQCGNLIVVGIRGIGECEQSLSGLHINSQPGVSLKVAAAIAPQEYEGGVQLLREKIKLATLIVKNDFKKMITPKFDFNAKLMNANKCEFSTGDYFWPTTAAERGIVISRIDTPYAKIKVNKIIVRSRNSGNAVLKILDGNEEYTYDISLVAGMNYFTLEQKFEADEIFITIDNSNFQMGQGLCDIHCNRCNNSRRRHIKIRGWDGNSENSFMYGINAEAQLICDEDELFCNVLDRLYFNILYQSAVQIIQERLDGPRLNNFTAFNTERAEKLVLEYSDKYADENASTAKSLHAYLSNMKDVCITCNSNRYVTEIP